MRKKGFYTIGKDVDDMVMHRDILWVVLERAVIPGQAMNAVHA